MCRSVLAPKEAQTWERVVKLIEVKQSQPYDEATALLKDLRDLAEQQGRLPEFSQRFEQLKSDYSSRPALMKRFRSIRICEQILTGNTKFIVGINFNARSSN